MSSNIKRLGDDDKYDRPKQTLQDKLSKKEIEEKLEDYIKVEDISEVPLKTHIRYFKVEGKNLKFRLGGNLINKDNADKYVVLSNGNYSWSADVKKSIFYKQLSVEEVREQYEDKIKKYKNTIDKLKKKLKQYED